MKILNPCEFFVGVLLIGCVIPNEEIRVDNETHVELTTPIVILSLPEKTSAANESQTDAILLNTSSEYKCYNNATNCTRISVITGRNLSFEVASCEKKCFGAYSFEYCDFKDKKINAFTSKSQRIVYVSKRLDLLNYSTFLTLAHEQCHLNFNGTYSISEEQLCDVEKYKLVNLMLVSGKLPEVFACG